MIVLSGNKNNKRKENPNASLSLADWSEVTGLSEWELEGQDLPLNALLSPRYPLLSSQEASSNPKWIAASVETISAMTLFTSVENRPNMLESKQHQLANNNNSPFLAQSPPVDANSLAKKDLPPIIWAKDVTKEVINLFFTQQSFFKRKKSLPENKENEVTEYGFNSNKQQDNSSNRPGF